jgi:hypothetical protein
MDFDVGGGQAVSGWPSGGGGLDEEAQGVTQFVRILVGERGYKPGDILVLSPRRHIGYGIREALRQAGVPTHSFYHEEALATDEAKLAFTLLTLLANPEDRAALRYWLGEDSPTWNRVEYGILRHFCEESGQSPWEANNVHQK